MKAHLSRRYRLSASHRLFCPDLDLDENLALFGKCANPHGHGHNYVVEVTVSGPVHAQTGMVIDLAVLDTTVHAEILDTFDHTHLNLHDDFTGLVPTTENFCIVVYKRLLARLLSVRLDRVRIEETANNSFEYAGE